ncbi:MAG: Deoxyhypusine synthase [Gammaproteobacteria bacterium]|nr:Deoxyhypusine synthase [Gammaproteobacteria bacterium]
MILKPAHQGGATPWHQDEAYRVAPDFDYRQVSIWVPLQDATLENGCMMYIPGSHRSGVLPHRSRGGIVIEALRKLRFGMWRQPARLKFEMRRAWRALFTFVGGK